MDERTWAELHQIGDVRLLLLLLLLRLCSCCCSFSSHGSDIRAVGEQRARWGLLVSHSMRMADGAAATAIHIAQLLHTGACCTRSCCCSCLLLQLLLWLLQLVRMQRRRCSVADTRAQQKATCCQW